jgi:uroporphyrinogen III methyltransferase/synthase
MSPAAGRGAGEPGTVLLVGAGPGDPDLITVRGAAALRRADAVVYDALAPAELLHLAAPEAERFNVGKRGHDEPVHSQDDINALLLRLAAEGKTVVRLKGGDPFVFGRGGEEATACAEAGIPFEVIPGVSSAIGALAYAGIPITDRRYSASFAVVTGHKDPSWVTKQTRWHELASAADTLVLLMGMRNLESILDQLMEGGRAPTTPAAAVMNGSLPSQRVVVAPLGELAQKVRESGIGAPAAVVVGDVVRLRESLAWYEGRPLFGARVLVTRPADQASAMVEVLRDAGAEAVVVPMIQLVPPEDLAPVDAALARLEDYDAILFTSANAIRFLVARAVELERPLRERAPAVACVGPVTADAARLAGFSVALTPESRHDAEGLLAAVEKRWPPEGRNFLLPQAEGARAVLADGLRARGASVDAVSAYRTLAADVDSDTLRQRLVRREFDALTFTSPSAALHFAELLDEEARKAVADCVVAGIGPVTSKELARLGFAVDVVPERPTARDLVTALGERMRRKREGEAR